MGNELDEVAGPVNSEGHDVNVINKQIKVECDSSARCIEIALWIVCPMIGVVTIFTGTLSMTEAMALIISGTLPGVIFFFMKKNALAYLRQLQQRIQADASQIDNYLEQRVIILQNVVGWRLSQDSVSQRS